LAILEAKTKEMESSVRLSKAALPEGNQINRRHIAAEIEIPAIS
jgi:hypothetical protein